MFESGLMRGLFRSINQVLIFVLLLGVALSLTGEPSAQRSIYTDLWEFFRFEDIQTVTSRDTFVRDILPSLSQAHKQYFMLSTEYFVNRIKAVNGDTVLLFLHIVARQRRPLQQVN